MQNTPKIYQIVIDLAFNKLKNESMQKIYLDFSPELYQISCQLLADF